MNTIKNNKSYELYTDVFKNDIYNEDAKHQEEIDSMDKLLIEEENIWNNFFESNNINLELLKSQFKLSSNSTVIYFPMSDLSKIMSAKTPASVRSICTKIKAKIKKLRKADADTSEITSKMQKVIDRGQEKITVLEKEIRREKQIKNMENNVDKTLLNKIKKNFEYQKKKNKLKETQSMLSDKDLLSPSIITVSNSNSDFSQNSAIIDLSSDIGIPMISSDVSVDANVDVDVSL